MNKKLTLEYRIRKLEEALSKEDRAELANEFAKICKSCNLPDPSVTRNKATSEFVMKIFYRRIQKRMRHFGVLKYHQDDTVKLVCDLTNSTLDIVFLGKKERVPLDEYTPIKFELRDRILAYIGTALDNILSDTSDKYYSM